MLIKVGTRKSKLAITQTNLIIESLKKKHPHLSFEIHEIVTTGDRLYDQNLALIGGKGLFLKEIEEHLLSNKIDIAIHSMKDVPVDLPEGLVIDTVSNRETANDVFLSDKYNSLDELPAGAVIGTSSARRRFQLLGIRPDLKVINFRGNVITRLNKIKNAEVDGAILAYAGISRLGLTSHIRNKLSFEHFLPAVGQGVIAIERRSSDTDISIILNSVHDHLTYTCIKAEREFMKEMGGNCTIPIAALCVIKDSELHMDAQFFDIETENSYKTKLTGPMLAPEELGRAAAANIRAQAQKK